MPTCRYYIQLRVIEMKGKLSYNEYEYIVGSSCQKRSKLESCVDILRVLEQHHPLKLTHIMHRSNLNCVKAKQFLTFLVRKELVNTRRASGEASILYSVTEQGIRVREHFRELIELLPIMEKNEQTVGMYQSLQKEN
jgi:predicted transcriptional regulator